MSAPSGSGSGRQLPVNLFTRGAYAIPQSTYFIPSDWRRFQLSELINKVLGHGGESGVAPVPFDFVVEGEVLRGTLEQWVRKHRGDDEETADRGRQVGAGGLGVGPQPPPQGVS
jgi:ribosome biogenesis protein YTM1